MPSNANLHDGVEERVAKNPVKYAWIQTLIFQELQTHTCPGHKVMISAMALTVNFPLFAPGRPSCVVRFSQKNPRLSQSETSASAEQPWE